ncbi:hypothetical protein [Terrimonas alba]|uniref:hypothetical protein n=1 Tax=Terrimonas alba TaxID=3349636 RepID=UPI0035F3DEF0
MGEEADSLANEISKVVTGIRQDINNGKGTVNALFKDSALAIKLNASLDNIQKGTDSFNQNMKALKHNFLLRGYFRKQKKQKRKEEAKNKVKGNNSLSKANEIFYHLTPWRENF